MASFVGAAAAAAATTGCGGLLYGLSTVGMAADDVNATVPMTDGIIAIVGWNSTLSILIKQRGTRYLENKASMTSVL